MSLRSMSCVTAQHQFPDPTMAIGAHDQQVAAGFRCVFDQGIAHLSMPDGHLPDARRDAMPFQIPGKTLRIGRTPGFHDIGEQDDRLAGLLRTAAMLTARAATALPFQAMAGAVPIAEPARMVPAAAACRS